MTSPIAIRGYASNLFSCKNTTFDIKKFPTKGNPIGLAVSKNFIRCSKTDPLVAKGAAASKAINTN